MDSPQSTNASTAREGRLYAERLIESTTKEFLDEMGEAVSDDVPAFVVRTLTDPFHDAIEAKWSSLPHRMVIDGVIVEFCANALRAFTDTIWQFVSKVADKVDESTLATFRGDG